MRELMAAKIILSVFAPEDQGYLKLSELDKSEVQQIGSLSNAQEAMKTFTADQANFKKTMEALAKSVSLSSEITPAL